MDKLQQYYVYILANSKPSLYIGVTNNLIRRTVEHKQKRADGFTKKYNINKLVYYEIHQDINEALLREKQLKHWKREWKIELIRKSNGEFKDLFGNITK